MISPVPVQPHAPGKHRPQVFEVLRTVALSIPNDTPTEIDFDFLDFDTISATQSAPAWTIGDPTNVILRQPGLFLLEAFVEFGAGAGGYRYVAIKQGAGVWRETRIAATPTLGAIVALTCQLTRDSAVPFTTGIRVRQTSGGAINAITPTFDITRITR